jgi:hypothetical protein
MPPVAGIIDEHHAGNGCTAEDIQGKETSGRRRLVSHGTLLVEKWSIRTRVSA